MPMQAAQAATHRDIRIMPITSGGIRRMTRSLAILTGMVNWRKHGLRTGDRIISTTVSKKPLREHAGGLFSFQKKASGNWLLIIVLCGCLKMRVISIVTGKMKSGFYQAGLQVPAGIITCLPMKKASGLHPARLFPAP